MSFRGFEQDKSLRLINRGFKLACGVSFREVDLDESRKLINWSAKKMMNSITRLPDCHFKNLTVGHVSERVIQKDVITYY